MRANNQRTQLIVLCCLIAVVLGLGVFRIVGTKTNAEPAKQQVQQSKKTEPVQEADQDSGVLVAALPGQSLGDQKARDPFAPQVSARTDVAMPSVNINLPRISGNMGNSMPPLPFLSPLSSEPIQVSVPTATEPDPADALRLTGVIEGTVNVAIIRGADDARFIVREGQTIDGKYTVESISRAGVRLKYRGRSIILRMGEMESR